MQSSGLPIQIGDVLAAKYVVERVLGHGGMGLVVAARHIDLGELYAIKFLLPQTLATAEPVERFLREARSAARLKNEHVARVHDVGRLENGAPYMVMEHLEGHDLGKITKERPRLPPFEAVAYVLQACEAIAEAHRAGIVHRDLKPGNLFLTRRSNGSPCVKVLDFGISKQLTEAADITKTGSIFGTPAYMPPEQVRGAKDIDGRADVWSLGVVLYRFLTGVTPFAGQTDFETVARLLEQAPLPPSSVCPDLPRALDSVVLRCLCKNREERYPSATALADALRLLGYSENASPREPMSSLVPELTGAPASAIATAATPAVSAATPAVSAQTPPRPPLPAPSIVSTTHAASATTVPWSQRSLLPPAPRAAAPHHSALPWILGVGGAVCAVLALTIVLVVRRPAADSEASGDSPSSLQEKPASPGLSMASPGSAVPSVASAAPPAQPPTVTPGQPVPVPSVTASVTAAPSGTASAAPSSKPIKPWVPPHPVVTSRPIF